MPQLDSLRAIGIAGVVLAHLAPAAAGTLRLGVVGVKPFFVLSGFLITGILLRGRAAVEAGSLGSGEFLRDFLLRRTARLFPLLLATLLCAALLDVGRVRETFFWHATYLTNFYLYSRGGWDGSVSHLWSLAVEEQFYLVWPWLILFLPRRLLLPGVTAAIAAGPVFRLAMHFHAPWEDGIGILAPACLDSLGMGALLALLSEREGIHSVARGRLRAAALWIGAPLAVALTAGDGGWVPHWLYRTLTPTGVALVSAWVVAGAASGFQGRAGRLLESRALVYLGTISYGIYVNHVFMPRALMRVGNALGTRLVTDPWGPGLPSLNRATFLAMVALSSVGLAALTWRWLESPLTAWARSVTLRPRTERRHAPGRSAGVEGSATADSSATLWSAAGAGA